MNLVQFQLTRQTGRPRVSLEVALSGGAGRCLFASSWLFGLLLCLLSDCRASEVVRGPVLRAARLLSQHGMLYISRRTPSTVRLDG